MARKLKTTLANKIKVKRIPKRLSAGEKIKLEQKTRSGLESKALDILNNNSIEYQYEPKDGKLNYIQPEKKRTYLPDVVIGDTIYELKGIFSPEDREKMLNVRDCNPTWNIIMVFQRNNPIRKGSKTRYGDWCDKHGFQWMMITDFELYIKNNVKNKNKAS